MMLRNKLKAGLLDLTAAPDMHLSIPPAGNKPLPPAPGSSAPQRPYRQNILLWFALMAVLMGCAGYMAYRNINAYIADVEWVDHTNQVLTVLGDSFSALKDVESGGRGYLLSGNPEYLEPTFVARQQVLSDLQTLKRLMSDNPRQLQRIAELEPHVKEKLESLNSVIALRQSEGFEIAHKLWIVGKGKQEMDEIRVIIGAAQDEEQRLLQERNLAAHNSARATGVVGILGISLSFSILIIVYFMIRRENIKRLAVEDGLEQSNAKLRRGFDEMEQLTREMNLVEGLGELLQSCLTFGEAGEVISKAVPQLLPGTAGALCIINPSKNLAETIMFWGEDAPHELYFSPGECWALRRGRLHFVGNKASDMACEHVTCSCPHGYLCVPLVAHGETLGVLHICASRPEAIHNSKQHIIRTICEQFSLTLANLRLQQTLRTQSIHDPLTGLFNRRYMEASLEREMLRAKRHETPLGVIMLDVDHFKRFNDTYGHGAGDILMQELGKTLKSGARGEDIVCRYGGEEFIAILPGASLEIAHQCARRISDSIRKIQAEYRGEMLGSVTVSLGVAAFPEHSDNYSELIRLADAALYKAKRAGRDRIVVADHESAAGQVSPAQVSEGSHVLSFNMA